MSKEMTATAAFEGRRKTVKGAGWYVQHGDGCGGQVAVGGTVTQDLPVGFGFRGSRFVIEKARRRGWSGFCLKCRASGFFWPRPRQRKAA